MILTKFKGISDMYDQGAEGARRGAFKEKRDEQKPSVLHPHSHLDKCTSDETFLSSEVVAINKDIITITCNGNTITCPSSDADGAGETSTQVEI